MGNKQEAKVGKLSGTLERKAVYTFGNCRRHATVMAHSSWAAKRTQQQESEKD